MKWASWFTGRMFLTSFYLGRLPGLHQQPLLFLCALLCCGGETGTFYLYFFMLYFCDLLRFLRQVVIKKWSIPCPLPNNVTAVPNDLQVKKPTVISTPLFIYALCKLDICRLEATGLWWKPTGLFLLVVPADEDQRRKSSCQAWGEGSSADLASLWKWPLAFWNYTNRSTASNLTRFPLDGCSHFRCKSRLDVSAVCNGAAESIPSQK